MSLGLVLTGVYLLLVALVSLFSIAVPGWLIGIVALVAGILLLLEAFGVYNRSVGVR